MSYSIRQDQRLGDIGLLLVRLTAGLALMGHGSQKLLGWFGGPGLAGTAGFFESLGFQPGTFFALAASSGEIFGGLLIALGLLGVVGPAIVVSVMLVAIVTVHLPNGFFTANNGFELPLLYAAMSLMLVFTGFGRFAVDAAVRARVPVLRKLSLVAVQARS